MHSFVLQVNAINYVLLPLLFRSLHTLFVSCVQCFLSLSLSLFRCCCCSCSHWTKHCLAAYNFTGFFSLCFFFHFFFFYSLVIVVSSPLYPYSVCGRGAHERILNGMENWNFMREHKFLIILLLSASTFFYPHTFIPWLCVCFRVWINRCYGSGSMCLFPMSLYSGYSVLMT